MSMAVWSSGTKERSQGKGIVRRVNIGLAEANLVGITSDLQSMSPPTGRIIADQTLVKLRAAAEMLDPERGQIKALLNAATPGLLRFEHLLEDAAAAIGGNIDALDRVADALRAWAELIRDGPPAG